jgi:hypothetical protein
VELQKRIKKKIKERGEIKRNGIFCRRPKREED